VETVVTNKPVKKQTNTTKTIGQSKAVLAKYEGIVGAKLTNQALYNYIDSWMGVKYLYGGKTKNGIDCSNFSCQLLIQVFDFKKGYYMPSASLAKQGVEVPLTSAKEGDLVFFRIASPTTISHVGVMLKNRKFVHASSSKGVTISSLDEKYYNKHFAFVRRISQ
jgi:lipoprotein Spr